MVLKYTESDSDELLGDCVITKASASAPNPHATTQFVSIDDTLMHVKGALRFFKSEEVHAINGRVVWPVNDCITVSMTGLPDDDAALPRAIFNMLSAIDNEGCVLFPVSSIRVDARINEIRIIGNRNHAYMMRSLPY